MREFLKNFYKHIKDMIVEFDEALQNHDKINSAFHLYERSLINYFVTKEKIPSTQPEKNKLNISQQSITTNDFMFDEECDEEEAKNYMVFDAMMRKTQ